ARFTHPWTLSLRDMKTKLAADSGYPQLIAALENLLAAARRSAARAVNTVMTATYWEVGRRIVEFEQGGEKRAAYGEELIARLAGDLTAKLGRGFGAVNLSQMKRFYLTWPPEQILQTASEKSAGNIFQTTSEKLAPASNVSRLAAIFPLPW